MNNRGWRLRWLLCAVGLVAASIPLGSSQALSSPSQSSPGPDTTAFGHQGSVPKQLTAAQRATADDPVPSRTYSSPFLLVDPDNPRIIVASAVEMRSKVCYLMRSTDAGVHWTTLPALPALASYPSCFTANGGNTESPMAWGRNHTLYYGLLGYGEQDGGASRSANMSVLLARSTDLGNSWSTTVVENARGKSGAAVENNEPLASIAVDSHHGAQDIVYVGWRLNVPNVKNAAPKSMVAASTNGGKTFSAPVDLSQFTQATFQDATGATFHVPFNTPHLAVNQKIGALYAVLEVRTFGYGAQNPPPQPLYLATSTDRGKTFAAKQLSRVSPDVGVPAVQWTPAGGSQGTLLAAFQDKVGQSQGSADIYVQRSTDGGATWSPEVRLNDDDPAAQTYHFLPNMSVAPNGRVDVAWYDFRNAKSFAQDVYSTYSTDAGATWASNIRVTDQLIDLSMGLNTNFDIRQPPGIASADQYATFGWADPRLGNPATQTEDVFTTVAQFAALPTGASSTLKYLAAAFAGLAAAGVIILALVAVRRRPRATETMPPAGPQPVGAG